MHRTEDEDEGDLELGYGPMDHEHRVQLSLLNDLKAAVRNGAGDQLVYALLHELVEQTNLHFLSEQLSMRLHAYAAMESHLEEHERLRATVQQVKQNLGAGNSADTQSLIEALRSWLSVHIQTTDRALANYLSQRVSGPLTEPEK